MTEMLRRTFFAAILTIVALCVLTAGVLRLFTRDSDGGTSAFVGSLLFRPDPGKMSGHAFVVASLARDDQLDLLSEEHGIVKCPAFLQEGYRWSTPQDILEEGMRLYEFSENYTEKSGVWTGKRYGYGEPSQQTISRFQPGKTYYVSGAAGSSFNCQTEDNESGGSSSSLSSPSSSSSSSSHSSSTPSSPPPLSTECIIVSAASDDGKMPPLFTDIPCENQAISGTQFSFQFTSENAGGEEVAFHVFPLDPFLDVNKDGYVTIADIRFIFSRINIPGAYHPAADLNIEGPDGYISPIDALIWSNYARSALPTGMVLHPSSGLLTWTPTTEQEGTHYVAVNMYTPAPDYRSPYSSAVIRIAVAENDGTTIPPASSSSSSFSLSSFSSSFSSSSSAPALCGNGMIEAGEECDDGNAVDGDGCFSTCVFMLPPTQP